MVTKYKACLREILTQGWWSVTKTTLCLSGLTSITFNSVKTNFFLNIFSLGKHSKNITCRDTDCAKRIGVTASSTLMQGHLIRVEE